MKQQDLGLNLSKRRTRKAIFLDEMNLGGPWTELLSLIAPHAPRARTGRPPFELESLSNVARIPDRVSILRFGKTPSPSHLLEEQQLARQILVTVTPPSPTKA